MDIIHFFYYDLFPLLLSMWSRIVGIFGTSIGELMSEAISIDLPNWGFLKLSLFSFMLGSGLVIFFGLTLIKWLADLIN